MKKETNEYDWAVRFGTPQETDIKEYDLPELTVYDQKTSDNCTGFAAVSAAELIFGKRFSPGWYMAQSKSEYQNGNGRFLKNVLDAMCNVGGVPLGDFGDMGEDQEQSLLMKDNPDLLSIAEHYKMDGFCNLLYANKTRRDNAIKTALLKASDKDVKMAVIATSNSYFPQNHCILLTGWNENTQSYKFQNSQGKKYGTNGRGEIPKTKIDAVYAIFKEAEPMPFKDFADGWSYADIQEAYNAGLVNGKTDDTLAPNDNLTREEFFAVVGRMARQQRLQRERDILINYQGGI